MACSIALSGLTFDCETSKGGIKEVIIAVYDKDVAAGIKASAESATSASTVSAGTWYSYTFRRNTGSMTSTLNVDDANGTNYVSTDLVLQFSRMDAKKFAEMKALSTGEVMAFVVDCNGEKWFLGADEAVVASAGTGQTGTAKGDGNYYQITLQANDDTYPINWAGRLPTVENNA